MIDIDLPKSIQEVSHLAKQILMIPKVLWTDGTVIEDFGTWFQSSSILEKNNIILTVTHDSSSVMVWDCFADSAPSEILNQQMM